MPLADALQLLEQLSIHAGVYPGHAPLSIPGEDPLEYTRVCVICMSSPRAVRFGCGHAACCAACAEQLRERSADESRCPTCREPITVVTDEGAHIASEQTYEEGAPAADEVSALHDDAEADAGQAALHLPSPLLPLSEGVTEASTAL